jgi:mRNA-degrading endonuclease RelE of RelBE toxin-antitoxin system
MKVEVSKDAAKSLRKAPSHVVTKFKAWVDLVEIDGISEARRIPGFHDEMLHGQLAGKRSIRLSLKWRAIYVEKSDLCEFILVEKVTAHEYKE